jgi:multiple sugar transport system permease protein
VSLTTTLTAHGETRARSAPSRKGSARARRDVLAALAFISPWIIGFLVFTAWPMIYSLYLSLTDYDNINSPNFVGLENYREMLVDEKVPLAIGNTFVYAIVSVPIHIIVALALALLLNQTRRGTGVFRTLFYLPKMTPQVAIGVLFLLLFNGQSGLINQFLGMFGINGPAWTVDPAWMKPGLILIHLWTVGSTVIILLAALKNVPKELYESARVDGASPWRQFRSITVPMISPQLFFVFIINSIAALQTFTEAYTAFFGVQGTTYSNDAVLFYSIYLFQEAFRDFHMGYASALAWVLFVIIMIITAIQMVVSRRFVFYQGEDG